MTRKRASLRLAATAGGDRSRPGRRGRGGARGQRHHGGAGGAAHAGDAGAGGRGGPRPRARERGGRQRLGRGDQARAGGLGDDLHDDGSGRLDRGRPRPGGAGGAAACAGQSSKRSSSCARVVCVGQDPYPGSCSRYSTARPPRVVDVVVPQARSLASSPPGLAPAPAALPGTVGPGTAGWTAAPAGPPPAAAPGFPARPGGPGCAGTADGTPTWTACGAGAWLAAGRNWPTESARSLFRSPSPGQMAIAPETTVMAIAALVARPLRRSMVTPLVDAGRRGDGAVAMLRRGVPATGKASSKKWLTAVRIGRTT